MFVLNYPPPILQYLTGVVPSFFDHLYQFFYLLFRQLFLTNEEFQQGRAGASEEVVFHFVHHPSGIFLLRHQRIIDMCLARLFPIAYKLLVDRIFMKVAMVV